MKNNHTLIQVGGSLFIFGLSMVLLPSIFEKAETHHLNASESTSEGVYLMIVGGIILLIKLYLVKKQSHKE